MVNQVTQAQLSTIQIDIANIRHDINLLKHAFGTTNMNEAAAGARKTHELLPQVEVLNVQMMANNVKIQMMAAKMDSISAKLDSMSSPPESADDS